MRAIRIVSTVPTTSTLSTPAISIGSTLAPLSTPSAILCAGAFVLLLSTALSDYLVRVMTVEAANWPKFFGQFALPVVPMVLVALLLATRNHAAATLVACAGTLLYLVLWISVAL